MPASGSPSVRGRRLAAEVRKLREAVMLTGDEVAARLGWSPSKVSRIENARTPVTVGDLRRLLDLYEVPNSLRDQLIELSRTVSQRGWWDRYSKTVRQSYATLIALEADAEFERSYNPILMHGLLQTEAYAEEIIRSSLMIAPPGEIQRLVTVRKTRQTVLVRPEPLQLSFVIDEAVLRRRVGGRDVMREQLNHVVAMSEHSNITVQVLPFTAGSHPAMQGGFTILAFREAFASDVVFLEARTSDLFVESEGDVYDYGLVFDRLRELALDERESTALISRMASEILLW